MEMFDCLYQISDISEEEYKRAKETHLSAGRSQALKKYLMGRSVVPKIRNAIRPPGEIYAPVYYTDDYMIKLVQKSGWGGYILALVVWDLVIIDIDVEEIPGVEEDHLGYIQKNVELHYPKDLFYINKTARGYHVYLVSRTLSHASKGAIFMRIKLNSDPAHGTNSLYTGSSIRLTSKNKGNNNPCISEFLTECGAGKADPKALSLYNTIQDYIKRFSRYGVDSIVEDQELMSCLYDMWMSKNRDFGLTHVQVAGPLTLIKDNDEIFLQPKQFSYILPIFKDVINPLWSSFLKYRVIRENKLDILLLQSLHQIGMNNLYRILEATEDYAVGVHVQESCYFISYRDLFYIDIDHKNRLQIIYQYVRYHPEATFRIVKTKKGYHAFLTSYPIPYTECMPLSLRLCADPCHLIGVYHRGYSVRVNQKKIKEEPYRELYKVGKAPECPRLYSLYCKHLELYKENCVKHCKLYMYQTNTSLAILEKEGL